MKKVCYLMAVAALAAACTGSQKGYTVTGTIEGATDGDTVFLATVQGRQLVHLDSAVIENGTFTFNGTQDTAAMRYITYQKEEVNLLGKFYLENGTIRIKIGKEQDEVTGTPTNELYQGVMAGLDTIDKQYMDLQKSMEDSTLTDEQRTLIQQKMQEEIAKYMAAQKQAIADNITNIVGVDMLKDNFYNMSLEELEPLMPQIPAEFSNDERIIRIKENVIKMKSTAVGRKFTDFTMQTPEGKEVKLSDYVGKGKVVLVDFWASWCGPCRREMPNLVEAYKQFKDKNFEIVGVSLDRDVESWKAAIKTLNITWPQMSDLKYWDCEGAKLYAVSSIPHTMLVDGEGTILARGLHGQELMDKLAEVLK